MSWKFAKSRPKWAANENFRKRLQTLGSKCSELWQDYEADVYFAVHRNGRFFTFASPDDPSWPLEPETLVIPSIFTAY